MKRYIIKRGYRFYPFVRNGIKLAISKARVFKNQEEEFLILRNTKRENLWLAVVEWEN